MGYVHKDPEYVWLLVVCVGRGEGRKGPWDVICMYMYEKS